MNREEFISKLNQYNHIIVYGAKKCAIATIVYLEALGLGDRVKVAVTQTIYNPKLVMGKKVRCIDEYEDLKEDSIVIIAAQIRTSDIERVILQKGYFNYVAMDYDLLKDKDICYEQIIGKRNSIEFEHILKNDDIDGLHTAFWLAALDKNELTVDIQIVGHCNLNCQGCNVFAPLVKNELLDIIEFEKDMKRMCEIVPLGLLDRITLIGGEPLLHPQINDFILIAKKYFPDTNLCVFTNGIKLLEMSEEFWSLCKEKNVHIVYTWYPIDIDYVKIESILKKKEIAYMIYNGKTDVKTSHKLPHNIEGNNKKEEVFHRCDRTSGAMEMKNGKLYPCSIAPSFPRFIKFFDLDIDEMDDGADIYKCQTYEELMSEMMQPMEACKYCGATCAINGLPWRTSQKSIDEWV